MHLVAAMLVHGVNRGLPIVAFSLVLAARRLIVKWL
jgi:hypothetical protein